jgi:hypothetical protein
MFIELNRPATSSLRRSETQIPRVVMVRHTLRSYGAALPYVLKPINISPLRGEEPLWHFEVESTISHFSLPSFLLLQVKTYMFVNDKWKM